MGMGSAYAGGGSLVQEQDSYVPLLKIASDSEIAHRKLAQDAYSGMRGRSSGGRSRGGGRSSADQEMERRRIRLAEQKADQEQRDEWSRKNQYMASHHGREPTPEEMAEMQRDWEANESGLRREEGARRFDETLASRERESALDREQKQDTSGLAEREDLRAQQKHDKQMTAADMELGKEAKTLEHDDMMKAFLVNDYESVENWFKNNAVSGKSGSLDCPMMEATDDPDMVRVKWPGKDEPQTMSKKALGQLLATLSPKYERSKGEKRKEMSPKDAAAAAAEYAKNGSEGNAEAYKELYREKYDELRGGGEQGGNAQGKKTIVKTQQDKATGHTKEIYNDGSWVIKDKTGVEVGYSK